VEKIQKIGKKNGRNEKKRKEKKKRKISTQFEEDTKNLISTSVSLCINVPGTSILKHPELRIQFFFFRLRENPFSPAIWKQKTGFYIIFQVGAKDDIAHDRNIILGHWKENFDPVVEVAGHKVGAPHKDLFFSAVPEVVYS